MAKLKSSNLLKLLGVLIVLLVWEIAAIGLSRANVKFAYIILPTIEQVVQSIPKLSVFWGGGLGASPGMEVVQSTARAVLVILIHSGITLLRVIGGSVVGAALGIVLGVATTLNVRMQRIVSYPINIVRQIPLLILIPLFMLWFGGKEVGKIIYIVFGIFIIIYVNTVNAINNVPIIQKQFALTLGANKFQLYKTVIMPSIIPELAGGIRVSLALAWAITLGAEYLAAQAGLGKILILAEAFVYTDRMVFITFLFMFYSVMVSYLAKRVIRRLTAWMPSALEGPQKGGQLNVAATRIRAGKEVIGGERLVSGLVDTGKYQEEKR